PNTTGNGPWTGFWTFWKTLQERKSWLRRGLIRRPLVGSQIAISWTLTGISEVERTFRMPIRVLHVVDHLGKGGLENGLANLIERLDPSAFEHVVYAIRKLGPNADRISRAGARVICQGKQDTDSALQVPTLARAIREIRPNIVHSRNWAAVEAV